MMLLVLLVLLVLIVTLLVLAVAGVGQALVVALGVSYAPSGELVNSTPLALVASYMAGIGELLGLPLSLLTAVLGLVTMALRNEYRWILALVIAGLLSLVGFLRTIWILLSINSPIAFVLPFALIAGTTLFHSLVTKTRPRTANPLV